MQCTLSICLCVKRIFQECQEVEGPNTSTDSGVSTLPVTDGGTEESQPPQEGAPVRFGWVTGVMVSEHSDSRTWTKASNTAYFNGFNTCLWNSYKHHTTNTCWAVFLNFCCRFVACWISGESSCFSACRSSPLRQAFVSYHFGHSSVASCGCNMPLLQSHPLICDFNWYTLILYVAWEQCVHIAGRALSQMQRKTWS